MLILPDFLSKIVLLIGDNTAQINIPKILKNSQASTRIYRMWLETFLAQEFFSSPETKMFDSDNFLANILNVFSIARYIHATKTVSFVFQNKKCFYYCHSRKYHWS